MQNAKKACREAAAVFISCHHELGSTRNHAENRSPRPGPEVATSGLVEKPYDIKLRTFQYACDVVRAYPKTKMDPGTQRIWLQFLAAATSGGAHLEEADAAASRIHFVTLARGSLRELRESNYWIRIIEATKLEGCENSHSLKAESSELVAILTTIVRRASQKLKRNDKRPGA
jgi:four helix bundle protein